MSKTGYYMHEPPRLSRQWWLQHARTLFWVAVVSVLIWIYADIEFTDNMEMRATVQLSTGSSDNLSLVSDPNQEVTFTLRGSQTQLEDFRRSLADRRRVLHYDVSQRYGVGEHTVQLAELLNQATDLQRQGISVQETRPKVVTFRVERQITEAIPVKLEYEGAEVADQKITPARVQVSAPSSVWHKIREAFPTGELVVRTQQLDLTGAREGETVRRQATLQPLAGRLTPTPSRVDVLLTIVRRTERKSLRVAVRVVTPFDWANDGTWSKYKLDFPERENWIRTLEFIGPRTSLEGLTAEDIDAYIELKGSDKVPTESWLTRNIEVRLVDQSNVQLAPNQQQDLKLEFRLKQIGPSGNP